MSNELLQPVTINPKEDAFYKRVEAAIDHVQSPTWPHVLEFAKRMEAKLEKNRHKGDREGWFNESSFSLLRRVSDEVAELRAAMDIATVRMREPGNEAHAAEVVADEAADVANFAMMIADWYTARVPVTKEEDRVKELEDLLRSAHAIADRKGEGTAWARFAASIQAAGVGNVTARTYRLLPDDQVP